MASNSLLDHLFYTIFHHLPELESTLVDITDKENYHPVPIEREKADRFYLRLAVWWLIFVVVVTILRSKPVMDFAHLLKSKLQAGPAPVVVEDHEKIE